MTGRVGETMWWDGPTIRVTNAAVTGPLRGACGPGRVVRVGTGGAALRRREGDENAARSLSNRYGMSIAQARGEVAACRADADRRRTALERRFGANPAAWPNDLAPGPCTPSPPRVVTDASACPPLTTLRGGLCLTERGLIVRDRSRPLL